MNMKKHRLPAVCAGIFASVTSAFAAVRTLPTPGPSGYVDREGGFEGQPLMVGFGWWGYAKRSSAWTIS